MYKVATYIASKVKVAEFTRNEMDDFEEDINKRLKTLKNSSSFKDAYITDRWKDGYFKIVLELNPVDKRSVVFNKNRPHEVAYKLPDLKRIKSEVNKVFKNEKPKFLFPSKKREYVDKYDDRKPESFYKDNSMMIEIYM